MVMKSGRSPFKLSYPNQRITELSSPFTREGDRGAESYCFPAPIAGSNTLLPHTGNTYITTGTPGSPNRIWIADWIDSTGENMNYPSDFYSPMDSNGPSWKTSPYVADRPDTLKLYPDDANSVNFSSSGQEFFDFQSSSSSDTGHSLHYVDQGNNTTIRQNVDDTSVSGSSLSGPSFENDNGSQGFYPVSGNLSHPDFHESNASDMVHYENSPLELQTGYPMDYMENSSSDNASDSLPQMDDFMDAQGRFQGVEQMDLFHAIPAHSQFAQDSFATVQSLDSSRGNSSSYTGSTWSPSSMKHEDLQGPDSSTTVASTDSTPLGTSAMETAAQIKPTNAARSIPLLPRPPVSNRQDGVRKTDEGRKTDGTRTKKINSTSTPRSHEHYHAKPGKDGFYHCPWKKKENCSHEPTKQKCTYDKHVDAHLKPYRCKKKECSSLAFSSNAVLGRHERETHGMHGHGENPYKCKVPDCRRHQPDQGFPRRWNARDHMKRVHGIKDFSDSEDDELDPVPEEPMSLTLAPTPRKKTGSRNAIPMKKTASSQSKRSTRSNPEERRSARTAVVHPAMSTQRRQSYPAQTVSIVDPGFAFFDDSPSSEMYPYTGFGTEYQTMDGVTHFPITYQC